MVVDALAAVPACFPGPLDDRQEMPVLRVVEHHGKFAGEPESVAPRIDVANSLERLVVRLRDLVFGH